MNKKETTIIGAGLVGSLLSLYLAKRGYKVNIYERRPDMRKDAISAGRSINLALSDRGFRGLEGVGLADEIRKTGIPMYGRVIHQTNGEVVFQPYGKDNQAIYSVSRGGLNIALMNFAESHSNVKIHFHQRCNDVDLDSNKVFMEDVRNGKKYEVDADLIFSADGAFSAVRYTMQKTDRFEYSQHFLEHGYKELTIPAGPNGEFLLDKNALHIWPRNSYMLIALPNPDGSFTCTLFFPYKGEQSFESLKTEEDVLRFFKNDFPDAVPLMPTLVPDFFNNPTGSLVTIKCFPWTHQHKMMMMGDAAHAIVPFFGQGMNSGFEDCTYLGQLMDEFSDDWSKIMPAFEQVRKPNTDAIAELAYENFIEMRDKVADSRFLLRKKIEKYINERYPDKFIPKYSMVTFSDMPYSEAFNTGKKQDEFFNQVMSIEHLEKVWETEEVQKMIHSRLREYGFLQ